MRLAERREDLRVRPPRSLTPTTIPPSTPPLPTPPLEPAPTTCTASFLLPLERVFDCARACVCVRECRGTGESVR